MKRFLLWSFWMLSATILCAQEPIDTASVDSAFIKKVEETGLSKFRKRELIRRYLKGKIKDLNNIDTAWISPNYYNYAFMIQNTNTYETFSIKGNGDAAINTLEFAPRPSLRLGAYFGWRWLFLGWTFDVNDIFGKKNEGKANTSIDLSLYSSKIGLDLYYRRTGNGYRLKDIGRLKENLATDLDSRFNGLTIYMKGLTVYYIFNHRKFSFPAAYSQSTEQRRSCGSWKLGMSWTEHDVHFDHTKLPDIIDKNISETMKFNRVDYTDISISCGYAYNWVFKHNCLFDISFTPAIAYTKSHLAGDNYKPNLLKVLTRFTNLNIDFITRVAVVWNNAHHFAGVSLIAHSFNYHKDYFDLNNTFGSLNFYVGLNFKRKKEYLNTKF